MSDILFKKEKPGTFAKFWSELARMYKAGPRLTPHGVAYALALAGERGLEDDRSFVVLRDGKPVAGALLPLGSLDGQRAITMGGDYVTAPLVASRAMRKEVFEIIDEEARNANVARALFMLDPLTNEPYNYLQEFGYLDTSTLTYVYDLTPKDLVAGCRRNHVRSLKEILQDKRFSVVRIDAENPDRAHHKRYEKFHEKSAGRKTRSTKTFNLQYEQLLAGEAVLFCVLMEHEPVAYGYFWHVHGKALYASVADDPVVARNFPLNHLLTLSGMHYYKERGFSALLPGEPSSPSPQFDYFPDAKQLHVGLFKAGFPGTFRPFYRGVRYYNDSAVRADARKFERGYADALRVYEKEHKHP